MTDRNPNERAAPESEQESEIDIYPDGWGMKIQDAPGMTPAEVQKMLTELKKKREGQS